MNGLRPISTMKLWGIQAIEASQVLDSPPIDLRTLGGGDKFSLHYAFGLGANLGALQIDYLYAAEKDGTYVAGAAPIASILGVLSIGAGTVSRAVSSNVATIETDAALTNLTPGMLIRLHDMWDSSYNGIHTVLSTPDTTHFTFALTHADETETSDTHGTVVEIVADSVDFSPPFGLPWLKIRITELADDNIDLASIWLAVQ